MREIKYGRWRRQKHLNLDTAKGFFFTGGLTLQVFDYGIKIYEEELK